MEENINLKKSITWIQGTALTIGAVVGSGILVLPTIAAEISGPASILSWLLMGLFSLPMVFAIGEMSSRYPNSGGIAAYAQQAFGPRIGSLVGLLILSSMLLGIPVTALVGAHYLGTLFGWGSLGIHISAFALLLVAVLFNCKGIELSGRSQLVVVSSILFILSFVVISAAPQVKISEFHPFFSLGFKSIGESMSLLFFAFLGWEMLGHLSEEFRDPRRDIPISLGTAFIVVNIIYISTAIVIVGSGVYKTGDPNIAMITLIGNRWGSIAGSLTAILGFMACYCPVHTYTAGFSRLIYSQAREGYFPQVLGKLHPRYRTPFNALMSFAPLLFLILFLSWYLSLDLKPLIGIPSTTFLFVYTIGMVSAARILPTKAGKFSGWLSALLSASVFLFSGWFMLVSFTITLVFMCKYRKDIFRGTKGNTESGTDLDL